MSDKKLPARLSYEKTKEGAQVEMRGTGSEIMDALVRLTYAVSVRLNMDVNRFATMLPALVELDKRTLIGTESFDMDAIQRAAGGDGE